MHDGGIRIWDDPSTAKPEKLWAWYEGLAKTRKELIVGAFWNWKHRTTDEAQKALSAFCTRRGHIMSIPVNFERDADCILSDVIEERDALRVVVEQAKKIPWAAIQDGPGVFIFKHQLSVLEEVEKIGGTRTHDQVRAARAEAVAVPEPKPEPAKPLGPPEIMQLRTDLENARRGEIEIMRILWRGLSEDEQLRVKRALGIVE